MDLGKIAQEQLDQVLGSTGNTKTKKSTTTSKTSDGGFVDDIVDSVDGAVKSKIPEGTVSDIADSVLDQNKDGHIVDDIVRLGGNLFKKK